MPELITNQALISYDDGAGGAPVGVAVDGETIWATQKSISLLFDVGVPAINKHLRNIFETGELEENRVISILEITAIDGKSYRTQHYNLDVIISIGYRVNSKKATQFRRWSTRVISQYIKDGFVIDEIRLRDNPEKLNRLAAKIRELRGSEKNVFSAVRECFKLAASDYEPSSSEVRGFYALLQDKFHHAVTKMTASKLKMDRADHVAKDMGLQTFGGYVPTLNEAQIGKNYLTRDELYRLYLLSEQFLLYAEATALRGASMTMSHLQKKLDDLLVFNEYPLFDGYKDFLKPDADTHVEKEWNNYIEIKKLEALGVHVDLRAFYSGEYEDYKEQTKQMSTQRLNLIIEEKRLAALNGPSVPGSELDLVKIDGEETP